MPALELLLEAERRGILPEDKKPLLAEARKRGLVPAAGAAEAGRPAKWKELGGDVAPQDNPKWKDVVHGVAGELLPGLGAVGGGTVGTPAGPVGAVAGAGLGYATGRKAASVVDRLIGYRTPPPIQPQPKTALGQLGRATLDTTRDVLTGATMEAGGQYVGNLLGRGVNALATRRAATNALGREGARTARVLNRMAPGLDVDAAEAAAVKMRAAGIRNPTVVEASGSEGLAARLQTLGSRSGTADTVARIRAERAAEMPRSTLRTLAAGTKPSTPLKVGRQAQEAAEEAIRGLEAEAGQAFEAAKPWEGAGTVDAGGAVKRLDATLKTRPENEKDPIRRVLHSLRDDFFKQGKEEVSVPSGLLDEQGRPLMKTETRTVRVPQDDPRVLEKTKKTVDALIDKSHPAIKDLPPALQKELERELVGVQKALVGALDEAAPNYAAARAAYAERMPGLRAVKKGIAGDVAAYEGDAAVGVARKLITGERATPDTARQAAALLRQKDPALPARLAKTHLLEGMREIKQQEGQLGYVWNWGGKFKEKLLGTQNQRDILRAYLGKEYGPLEDLAEVLDRTKLLYRTQSTTAAQLEMAKEMEGAGTKLAKAAKLARPMEALKELGDYLTTRTGQERALKALTDPRAIGWLRALRKAKPGSPQYWTALTKYMGRIGAYESGRALGAGDEDAR